MRPLRAVVCFGLFLCTASSVALAADLLPLEPGTYVRQGDGCSEPAFASILNYDGHAFSGAHSSRCTSSVVAHDGADYTVSTTCSGLGDGTSAAPYTEVEQVTIESPARLRFAHAADDAVFERCNAS